MNLSKGTSSTIIAPGAVIGILGGGQLGRMLSMEAARLGYRVHIFEPESGCPAGQVSEAEVNALYTDDDALRRFAEQVDVVTYEFENIPLHAIETVAEAAPVRPRGSVLHICQNREREKNFLREAGIPCAQFYVVDSCESLEAAMRELDGPGVLKTADFGYDGKGQVRVRGGENPEELWSGFGALRGVLESFVDFTHELSVVCARGADGSTALFPVVENQHSRHILDFSIVPARIPEPAQAEARDLARRIAEALDVVGLITIEFFLTSDGRVLVNEMAPRPHNSGHFSLDACVTSQFEQQVRAVCGLPLGSTELLRPVVMWNILGDIWQNGEPAWADVLRDPDVKLHLYGKGEARVGRKMGHICIMADSADHALERATQIKQKLLPG